MCSIAGIISFNPNHVDPAILGKMNEVQQHRGPDGEGYYFHQQQDIHIGFGHRRLSILDLSDASAQPFRYLDRYVMIYNGEIYNYKEIRAELHSKGYSFRTTGDTEVLVAAFDAYGENCLDHFDGMFAFAIWDEQTNKLFCARDRFGEKPFYYHYNEKDQSFYFASEMKALFAAGIEKSPESSMLYNYLTLGSTKLPNKPEQTFYQHISQLGPSHQIVFEPLKQPPVISRYWDLDKETVLDMPEDQALEKFSELLGLSVQRRMRSDVSIGTSLSGGLDSSSIVALAAERTDQQYSHQCFSAVFPGFEKDESEKIRKVAGHFNLSSHTVIPTAELFSEQLEQILFFQEEPIGSSSVFAQFLIYGKAKEQGVKVLLDGQGADELLGGYTKYTHWWLQEMIRSQGWSTANATAAQFKENGFLMNWNWKNRVAAMMPGLTATVLKKKALRIQRSNAFIDKEWAASCYDQGSVFKPIVDKLNDIQYADLMIQGLEELLRYADRNSMAHGRELRLPFLSHELVQFVLSLPPSYRMKNGFSKWILRKSMSDKLPADINWQKGKIGFEPPQQLWMAHESVSPRIFASRQKLVDLHICTPEVLKKPVVARGAHDEDNFDFRCLTAGLWL